MVFNPDDFASVNTSFSQVSDAQVVVWRGSGEWFTWTFAVDSYDEASHTIKFGRGGFQGAEGSNSGGRWYLEGLLELLDSPQEFYFDTTTNRLYFYANTSSGVPPSTEDMYFAPKLEEVCGVAVGERAAKYR